VQVKSLFAALATLGCGVLAGCGSNSPTEVIVEPGITAIREGSALACSSDLGNLQLAIEAYTTLNVNPPVAESDLVPEWLRAESDLYDLVGGQIVPAPGSECPAPSSDAAEAAPATTPSGTSSPSQDPLECDQQRTLLQVALDAYVAANGSVPATEGDLVPKWLRREASEYDILDGAIVPAPGTPCPAI